MNCRDAFTNRRLSSAFALLVTVSCSHSFAADRAGIIKSVTGTARIERAGTVIPAAVGVGLESNDRIVTTAASNVGIALSDDTLLAVGPASTMSLDKFAFNPTSHEGNLAVRILSGTMRMVTGLIAKQKPDAVEIKTPSAVIGVRGTDFIIEVPAND